MTKAKAKVKVRARIMSTRPRRLRPVRALNVERQATFPKIAPRDCRSRLMARAKAKEKVKIKEKANPKVRKVSGQQSFPNQMPRMMHMKMMMHGQKQMKEVVLQR